MKVDAADELRRLVEGATRVFAPAVEESIAEPFRVVDMAALERDEHTPQGWAWDGYIPAEQATLAGGHGGAGKSTFAVHVGACVAMGAPAFGRATQRARVLFFSGEDPASLVLARLRRICHQLAFPLSEVRQWVQVLDACELDPVLFAERRIEGVRHGIATATYRALAEYIEREQFGLVIIDNASDVFDADEINRSMVRAFIRQLVQLVRPHGGAVLLLAHVDKLTSRAGKQAGAEAYSGSTAWHNSVRSRLFLLEHEPGELELLHQKSNLGPKQPPLRLEWPKDGIMQLPVAAGGFVAAIEAKNDTRALLELLHEFATRGEYVSTATHSRTNAALLLAREKCFPTHLKAPDVFDLLRSAERAGLIRRDQYRNTERKPRERWRLTAQGFGLIGVTAFELNGVAPGAPSAPSEQLAAESAAGAPAAPGAPCAHGGYGGERAHNSPHLGGVS